MPDGKITNFRDVLYYGTNKVRLASYNDIIDTSISLGLLKQLQGSFQLDRSVSSSNHIINLGSTPQCLFIGYDMNRRMYGRTFTAYKDKIPMIVLNNQTNTISESEGDFTAKIIPNGFSYDYRYANEQTDILTLNYISFYIA